MPNNIGGWLPTQSIDTGGVGPKGDTGATGASGPNLITSTTSCTVSGLLKGVSSFVAQAVSGTDYSTFTQTNHDALANPHHSNSNDPTAGEKVVLGNTSGTNTGDNATNSQYSGLASSKQDTLVSGTNIKTINSVSVLGAGDLVVSGVTNIKQTEIDFGATPISEASFLITDADVLVGSQLIGSVAYEAPTGKDLDELEMDGLDLKFAPGAGQFTLYARGLDGYIADKFKINYLAG